MAQVGSNYEKNNWRSKILLDCPFKRKNKLSPYPDLPGYSVGGRGEHDEHVVERLQLQVISQQAPQHSQHALKLHLVLQLPRPGGGEPLLVLQQIRAGLVAFFVTSRQRIKTSLII